MAENKETAAAPESPDAAAPKTIVGRVMALREWATGSPLRGALVGGGFLALAGGTIAVWLFVASLAAPQHVPSIEVALEKLDEGDFEYAENYVRKMQKEQSLSTSDYGGPLFVLGAVRAKEAEQQWAPERRRRHYLIAAKYLDEARSLGVPEGREYEALFLLGKSYIGSDRLAEGVEALTEALSIDPTHNTQIHGLLAKAHYFARIPDYAETVGHLDRLLAAADVAPDALADAMLLRARALSRLNRHAEARETLNNLPSTANPSRARLTEGHVLIDAAAALQSPADREALLDRAHAALVEAEQLDKLSTEVTGASLYLRGRVEMLRGSLGEAVRLFEVVRKRFGMNTAGIAASAAEGDALRDEGRAENALMAYRRSLDAVNDMTAYQSDLLPTVDLKAAVLAAHGDFVADGEFEVALELIALSGRLLTPDDRLELRAETQQRWGERLKEAAEASTWPPEIERESRRRFREAGVSFERLAKARFATIKYPNDLWRAAEAYYNGQSYSAAVRVLRDYVKNEPLRYNAQALLRLGQSLLALGQSEPAVEAFEECIEFHPFDAAVYGARLSAARAHRDRGEYERAEELLRENLIGGTLSPRSPEWRDSKFEIGSLLHEMGRHTDAIDHLEEAINRYPGAAQQRSARYLVAESYRRAAEEPMRRFAAAKAVNEREKNQEEFTQLLTEALRHYDFVQREISRSNAIHDVDQKMLRNCYMLKGSVLFDLGRYREAVDEYSNVSALYQNEPFVLETLLQISYCWRRLEEPVKARGNIEQALLALNRLPSETDFLKTTTRSRVEWEALLNEVRNW